MFIPENLFLLIGWQHDQQVATSEAAAPAFLLLSSIRRTSGSVACLSFHSVRQHWLEFECSSDSTDHWLTSVRIVFNRPLFHVERRENTQKRNFPRGCALCPAIATNEGSSRVFLIFPLSFDGISPVSSAFLLIPSSSSASSSSWFPCQYRYGFIDVWSHCFISSTRSSTNSHRLCIVIKFD